MKGRLGLQTGQGGAMTSEIRLLSVITRMNVGGPAVQISALMRGLRETEVHQILLTGQVAKGERDYLDESTQDLRFVRVHALSREINIPSDLRALRQIVGFIRGFDPHIIHSHTAKAGALARTAAQITRSPAKRIHTFHGHVLHGYFSPGGSRAVLMAEKILARNTDILIAVGEETKSDLLMAGIGSQQKFRVVPPGVSLREIPSRREARQRLGLGQGSGPTVCFLGRLTQIKRIDRLVEVIGLTRAQVPDVEFVVAGDGDEAGVVAKAISDGLPIHHLGWTTDVEAVLGASDAMVLTSDNEGTPVSLIQAALAGLPSVATDVGSVKNVLIDGKTGLLADLDPRDISFKLAQILKNNQMRRSLGERALIDANNRFAPGQLVDAHLQIYREVHHP